LLEALHNVHGGLSSSGLARFVAPRPVPPRSGIWFWATGLIAALVLLAVIGYRPWKPHPAPTLIGSSGPIQLAVLPFAPTGDDPASKAFCNGLTETLAAKLTQLSGSYPLQVVPVSDVRAEGVTSVEQARKNFGVNMVLEGSLHGVGNQARVTYTLVDAKANRQLRAESFDTDLSDTFGVEDRVVEGTLRMLGLSLQGNERVVLAAHGTGDPSAYDQYLRGRGYLLDYHKHENIENAISAFNRALTLDPKYAQAYAALGEAYLLGYQEGNAGSQWMEKARSACDQAVVNAPRLADGYACLGRSYRAVGEYEKAAAQFQKAAALDATSDDAFRGLADVYQKLNRPAEAEATFRKAISLRPQYWAGYSWLGAFYYSQGRYEDAAKMFKEVIDLAPDNFRGYSNLGAVYVAQSQYQNAISLLEKSASLRPTVEAYSNLGSLYFSMRKFDDAAHEFEQGLNLDKTNWVNWGNLGDAYYWNTRRKQEAADAYRQAIHLADENLRVNSRDGYTWAMRSTYFAMTDKKADALTSLEKALSLAPLDPEVRFRAALVYNHIGDTDRALEWLRKALAAGYAADLAGAVPDFDHLRTDERFQAILRSAKH
jgi:tetratricopeptide (TPR) repeat protein